VGRRQHPLDPNAGPLEAFANDLRRVRESAGNPGYRALARRAGYSASTLSVAASGSAFPTLTVTLAYVGACGGDAAEWEQRWRQTDATLAAPVAAVDDPPAPKAPAPAPAELAGAALAGAEPAGAALAGAELAGAEPAGPGGPIPPPISPIPHELPFDVSAFTGRATELAELDRLLAAAGSGAKAVVAALTGTAGVGKTATAVHWAHRAAAQFPDGQLYVDLCGHGPDRPVQPREALGAFLRALGVPGADIPHGVAERAARFRTMMAGRRTLTVLDNAQSTEQIRLLLPGTSAGFVLVTSRNTLADLVAQHGAHRIELDLLRPAEATDLLRTLVGAPVDADPAAAATLAERCARLPLTLRIAAQLAATRPRARLAELAAELADGRRRLDVLDDAAEERGAVRAVFSWSVRRLPPKTARAFRLLGLYPGRDIDRPAAAALLGVEVEQAQRLLDALVRAHVVRRNGSGGYTMHSLLRAYAAECAAKESESARREALSRLRDHHLNAGGAAVHRLRPAERRNRARVAQPPGIPVSALTVQVPTRTLLTAGWAGLHNDDVDHFQRALTLSRELGDRAAEAQALTRLGAAHWQRGHHDEALAHYERALKVFREIGDRVNEDRVLANLSLHRR